MTLHSFQPHKYYTTIGSHESALIVQDGDTIVTSTVDARGWDHTGESATARGNPMTGPFYIEGASPGDALEVRFQSITPNRDWGWTSNRIAPHLVEPEAARTLPPADIFRWKMDVQNGLTSPEQPAAGMPLLHLAIRPFLGCFGVAPAKEQSISTATSGEYGGNMDYKGFVAGVSAFFPVFAEGALLHLGDGHAVQGCGEIAGTGVEISMDVCFSVHIHKGRTIRWPRGESDSHLFCIGNARPLEQALQHATTEMLSLLQEDYGLSMTEASLLLGQIVEYEIANVFNPAYSVVCKVSKEMLKSLR